jgi:alkaline phosphatase D
MSEFKTPPFDCMVAVGRVEPRRARIWARAPQPGLLTATCWEAERPGDAKVAEARAGLDADSDSVAVFDLGGDGGLKPGTWHRFEVVDASGRRLGEGRFKTAPEGLNSDRVLRVGLMSCHQPFDPEGRVRADAREMLRALLDEFEHEKPAAIFTVGDQMYTDEPAGLSLWNPEHFERVRPPGRKDVADCSAREVRRLLDARYRTYWNIPEWQELHAKYPCYPILDDHEIVDNWGSIREHVTAPWREFGIGARGSYFDYQGSRVLPADGGVPDSFHYFIEHGPFAAFVMDLRSERTPGDAGNGRLFSERQEADFRKFLADHGEKPVLFIVFTVPIIHLPRGLARAVARIAPFIEDFSDRWSTGSHIRDRDRMLWLLHEHQRAHPRQRIVLLSGDIHIGCAHALDWGPGRPPLYQFISSGVTHRSTRAVYLGSEALIRLNRRVTLERGDPSFAIRLVKGVGRANRNPYGGLNAGMVEMDFTNPRGPARIRFVLYGCEKGAARRVFESGWL